MSPSLSFLLLVVGLAAALGETPERFAQNRVSCFPSFSRFWSEHKNDNFETRAHVEVAFMEYAGHNLTCTDVFCDGFANRYSCYPDYAAFCRVMKLEWFRDALDFEKGYRQFSGRSGHCMHYSDVFRDVYGCNSDYDIFCQLTKHTEWINASEFKNAFRMFAHDNVTTCTVESKGSI